MATFKLYLDNSSKYRWNLNRQERDDIFADSGRGYTTKNQALDAIALVRTLASGSGFIDRTDDSHTDPPDQFTHGYFELYRDNGSKYRWRLKSREDILISDSTHGLVVKEDALRDIQMVRELVLDATLLDQTEGGGSDPQVPYNLGALPPELTIQWPTLPQIEYTVEVNTTPDDGALRAVQAHTRLIIATNMEQLTLAASDIEVQVNEGVHIGRVYIEKELDRFYIRGGAYGQIELAVPGDFSSTPAVYNQKWLIEDVLIENVMVTNLTSSAFNLRGKRIAVLNSHIQAYHYSVWASPDTTEDFRNEDIILAGNVFESAGPEATVRLVSVLRSVVVDNQLINVGIRSSANDIIIKHNYRIHGQSDLNFAARNTLIKNGLMIGTMDNDHLGKVWFLDNFIYLLTHSLLDTDLNDIDQFVFSENTIFCEVWDHDQILLEIPDQWTFENNYIRKLAPS